MKPGAGFSNSSSTTDVPPPPAAAREKRLASLLEGHQFHGAPSGRIRRIRDHRFLKLTMLAARERANGTLPVACSSPVGLNADSVSLPSGVMCRIKSGSIGRSGGVDEEPQQR
ncbi:MAG: hypothetical protein U0792_18975 [Gemmataceae bacterium]